MPQISTQEFERLPLRVHDFLAGVPLHDVWSVDLPRARPGITLDEFLRTLSACLCAPTPLARAPEHPSLRRRAAWQGSRAGHNRLGILRNASDNRRSLEVPCASGHVRRTFPRRRPLRERATPRADQPYRPRRSAERPCRNG